MTTPLLRQLVGIRALSYVIGNGFAHLLQIVTFFYVARVMGAADLGILSFALVVNQFLTYVPVFTFPSIGVRRLVAAPDNLSEVVSNITVLRLSLVVIACGLAFIVSLTGG